MKTLRLVRLGDGKALSELGFQWLRTRPECVQKLLAEFPPLTEIDIDGRRNFVIGCDESDNLLISEVDPSEDYDAALESSQKICAKHLRET